MMYLIFSFSSQTGEVSGELSYKISYNIVEIKSEILHEGKSYDELNYEANSIQFYVRKAAHVTEYFLLSVQASQGWMNTINLLFPDEVLLSEMSALTVPEH